MNWQPIETAPKDGRLVLLVEKYENTPFIGHWNGKCATWEVSTFNVYSRAEGGLETACFNVSHWCSIPPITQSMFFCSDDC